MKQEEKIDKILEFTSKINTKLEVVVSEQKQLRKELDEEKQKVIKLIAFKDRAFGALWLGAIIISTAISLIVKFA